mgnify:CR=1 FL=1
MIANLVSYVSESDFIKEYITAKKFIDIIVKKNQKSNRARGEI